MRASIFSCVCLAFQVSVAQSGPGGVGDAGSNVLWLSAENGAYSDAGVTLATNSQNVRQWNDRSGNGRHAIQATVGNRPNWHSNALNGYPVMRYTAANNDRIASTGLNTANVASVFVVARYTTLPSPNPGLVQGTPAGLAYTSDAAEKSIGLWVASSNTRVWGRGVQSNGVQRNTPLETPLAANTTYTLNAVYNGSIIQQYVNNGTAGSESYNGTLRSWTDMAIGAQHGTESWNGDIAEVVVYNTNVNHAQRIIIANYLAAKYGHSLAANDVYREDAPGRGNFDHDVAGIGRINNGHQHTEAQGTGIVRISNPTNLNDNEFLMWGHDNGMLGAWGVGDVPDGVQGRLERVWRVSERNTNGTASVDVGAVDITFDLVGLGNVDPAHLRLIVDTDNNGVFANEIPLAKATHLGGTLYRFAGVVLLRDGLRFTLGTTNLSITPLPIELLHFKAQASSIGTVDLSWATASEWNNDHFTVERSADLDSWTAIATVEAVGHSSALAEYSTTDAAPVQGANYYRLRQTDVDGRSTTSAVEAIEFFDALAAAITLYPNPTNGALNVSTSCPEGRSVEMLVLDNQGRALKLLRGESRATLHLDDLANGTYMVQVRCGTEFHVERVQVMH